MLLNFACIQDSRIAKEKKRSRENGTFIWFTWGTDPKTTQNKKWNFVVFFCVLFFFLTVLKRNY